VVIVRDGAHLRIGKDFVDAVTGTAIASGIFGIRGIDRSFSFSSTQPEEVSRAIVQQAAKKENLVAVFGESQ